MNIDQLLQNGTAAGIAVFLVWYLVNNVDKKLNELQLSMTCIVEALGVKKGGKNGK